MAQRSEDGLAAAVASIGAGDAPKFSGVQQALFPADEVANLPADQHGRSLALKDRSKGGRPAGSPNKATREWADYLLSRYISPLQFLAEAYTRPVHLLAEELGCSRKEAFDVQVRAASELAPYIHGKAPVEIKADGALPMLLMVAPDQALSIYQQSGEAAPPAFDLASVERVENQEVSDADGEAVGQSELDSAAICEDDQGLADDAPLISDQPGRVADLPDQASPDASQPGPAYPPPSRPPSCSPQSEIGPTDFPEAQPAKNASTPAEGAGAGVAAKAEPGSPAVAQTEAQGGRG